MAFYRSNKKTKKTSRVFESDQLTTLINSMADAVIALDEHCQVVRFNAAALNILDLNNLPLLTPLDQVFRPMDKNNQSINLKKLILSTKVPITNRDYKLGYSDGSKINLFISIAPMRLGYGSRGQRGYVLLLRDITREKSLEEERDEFISVTSHELRTPIAVAEGNLSNAMFLADKSETSIPDTIKQALASAHDQILFLADMINDLSTLSRAERGVLQVDVTPMDIHKLVTGLVKSYESQANDKQIKLTDEVAKAADQLKSSQLYVQEILQNFITNAIKYTKPGGHIQIKVEPTKTGIKFSVSDNGIGISKADQERVFDKFFRSEDYRTRQANGTGLGLYVTMKLCRLIHAEVNLISKLDEGSTFTVIIPNLD